LKPLVVVDTGPLVAYLSAQDVHHVWATELWKTLSPPLRTCEPVLSEAVFVLQRQNLAVDGLFELLNRGVVEVAFALADAQSEIAVLVKRYKEVPMSLADACLVRMSEAHAEAKVFTLDQDFRFYRRHGRQIIPLIAPW
jgi:predicted nucleic acid-binding protein